MAAVTVTYTFVNSQTSDGPAVSQNFTDIVNGLGDGTKTITVGSLVANGVTVGSAANRISGLATIINGAGTLTLPTSTDTLVGKATTDILTNKTLTAPVIATIVNGAGTLTLPSSTDTLVGKATTDILTNKTISSATFTGTQTLSGTLTINSAAAAALIDFYSTLSGANAFISASVLDTTGGDPTFRAVVTGGLTWTWGADNSDGDKWKLAQNGALGSNDYLTVDANGVLQLGTQTTNYLELRNQADPGAITDGVRLGSVDLSAGNATLSLRTETAVVVESVVSDRTLSIKINGTAYKICLKV